MSELEHYSSFIGRELYLLDVDGPHQIPGRFKFNSPHFVCLLAWDASKESAGCIGLVTTKLYYSGVSYICVWGPDSERVHDIFEETEVMESINQGLLELADGVIMSTWHTSESLKEIMAFSLKFTEPSTEYSNS